MSIKDSTYESNHYLTLEDADYRSSHIKNVSYKLTLALPKGNIKYVKLIMQVPFISGK
jgi:hypothetical protein